MLKSTGGYYPANPQTKYAVLGCGFAFLAFLFLMLIIFAFGAVA